MRLYFLRIINCFNEIFIKKKKNAEIFQVDQFLSNTRFDISALFNDTLAFHTTLWKICYYQRFLLPV